MADDPLSAGGTLFPSENKTTERSPDYTGSVTVPPALAQEIMRQAQAGQPVRMRLAGWVRTSTRGGPDFLSLQMRFDRPRQAYAQPQRPTQPSPQPQRGGLRQAPRVAHEDDPPWE